MYVGFASTYRCFCYILLGPVLYENGEVLLNAIGRWNLVAGMFLLLLEGLYSKCKDFLDSPYATHMS